MVAGMNATLTRIKTEAEAIAVRSR